MLNFMKIFKRFSTTKNFLTLLAVILTGCGFRSKNSDLLDEVDPTGNHETHYVGKVTLKMLDSVRFPDFKYEPPKSVDGGDKPIAQQRVEVQGRSVSGYTGGKINLSDLTNTPIIRKDIKILKDSYVGITSVYPLVYSKPGHAGGWYRRQDTERAKIAREQPKFQNFEIVKSFKRIDVNDMLVTRQDGTTYYIEAHVQIYMYIDSTGHDDDRDHRTEYNLIADGVSRSGVTVPTGYKYLIIVQGRTEEGVDQTDRFELDFR